VPAAIMSIAAANTFSRNIYKEWLNKDATPAQEAKVSKLMSLVVKAFALVFVLTLDKQNAINFQLLGGIWILQTFPAVVFSLFTRWFHRYGLLVGWAAGMVYGTVEAYQVINPVTGKHFGGSLGMIPGIDQMGYIAMTAFAINVVLAVVISALLNATKVSNGRDETIAFDYFADADDPRVQKDLVEHDTHDDTYGDADDIPGNAGAR
jgi:SSS family solute:Na+ symporter